MLLVLSQCREASQRGDRRLTLSTVTLPQTLTQTLTAVPVEVVVASGAQQGAGRGQSSHQHTSTVGVGWCLPERHWERNTQHVAGLINMTMYAFMPKALPRVVGIEGIGKPRVLENILLH
jgi:hypothetical protein